MKVNLLLITIALLFLGLSHSNAQPYAPMLGDSSHWWVVSEYFGYRSEGYFAKEDTIMDNKTYKFIDGFHFNKNVFLREDTILKHVYYRQKKGYKANEDVLIYDFSLKVGDSMLLYNPNTTLPDSVGYYVVDSIAMTMVLTGNRRTWYLSKSDGSDAAMWIEGIGSTSLVNSSSGIGDAVNTAQLNCFHKDEVHIYQTALAASFASCEINTVGINQEDDSQPSLVISPNPTTDFVKIDFPESNRSIDVFLFHSDGRLLEQHKRHAKTSLDLDLRNYENGLYFVYINDASSVYHAKLIKK